MPIREKRKREITKSKKKKKGKKMKVNQFLFIFGILSCFFICNVICNEVIAGSFDDLRNWKVAKVLITNEAHKQVSFSTLLYFILFIFCG